MLRAHGKAVAGRYVARVAAQAQDAMKQAICEELDAITREVSRESCLCPPHADPEVLKLGCQQGRESCLNAHVKACARRRIASIREAGLDMAKSTVLDVQRAVEAVLATFRDDVWAVASDALADARKEQQSYAETAHEKLYNQRSPDPEQYREHEEQSRALLAKVKAARDHFETVDTGLTPAETTEIYCEVQESWKDLSWDQPSDLPNSKRRRRGSD